MTKSTNKDTGTDYHGLGHSEPKIHTSIDNAYIALVRDIFRTGEIRSDRTGVGTKALFGKSIRCDLNDGFPLLTTKKLKFLNIVSELMWFLKGDSSLTYLHKYNNHIWDANYQATGKPAMYPQAWRGLQGTDGQNVDQIANLIEQIKTNPTSRRHIVVSQIPQMASKCCLDACHTMFQVYIDNQYKLHLQMYQRSADVGLGLPYNIASYALLAHILAHECDLDVGTLTIVIGDAHIYLNHVDGLMEQCMRQPYLLPRLYLCDKKKGIDNYNVEDFYIGGYESHPFISLPMAV